MLQYSSCLHQRKTSFDVKSKTFLGSIFYFSLLLQTDYLTGKTNSYKLSKYLPYAILLQVNYCKLSPLKKPQLILDKIFVKQLP